MISYILDVTLERKVVDRGSSLGQDLPTSEVLPKSMTMPGSSWRASSNPSFSPINRRTHPLGLGRLSTEIIRIRTLTERAEIRMLVRDLISDLKAYPTTLAFCVAWILIFVAMVAFQLNGWSPFPWKWSMLMIGMTDGNQFGDLTIRDFRHGEFWRLITCNFVHYGLLHLGLNLLAMYQLGAIVEEWYGPYQMVFVYAITGVLGNLVSVSARMALGHEENIHSGGGSVVILGLVGLCAVVGWRSHTRRGVYLGQQMINVMILTAVLGLGFPLFVKGVGVDNWGHTGGAVIGALVGFWHHHLTRNVGRPRAFELGVLSLILMLGCGLVQARNELGHTKQRQRGDRQVRLAADRPDLSNYSSDQAAHRLSGTSRHDGRPAGTARG